MRNAGGKQIERPRMALARVLSGLAARSSRPRGRCRGRRYELCCACVSEDEGASVECHGDRPLARNAALAVRAVGRARR
jgi:hypothetical protein